MKKRVAIEHCNKCPHFRQPIQGLAWCDLSYDAEHGTHRYEIHGHGRGIPEDCPLPDAEVSDEK